MYQTKLQNQRKFNSDVDNLESTETNNTRGLLSNEAIKNSVSWAKWLTYEYTSRKQDEQGKFYNGPKLDNCPACSGLGTVGVKVKRKIYTQTNLYDEAMACNICLTGNEKKDRLGLVTYIQKPTCQFMQECPFKTANDKQLKCKLCVCKFDKQVAA